MQTYCYQETCKQWISVFNYKGFFSIVILAVVDVWVDIGSRGASSDAQIFNNSELKECMEDNSIDFPAPEVLPHDVRQKVPFFCVGDDAFALQEYMMKPFSRRGVDMDNRIFNYPFLSHCRRISENAFGIMAYRWQKKNVSFGRDCPSVWGKNTGCADSMLTIRHQSVMYMGCMFCVLVVYDLTTVEGRGEVVVCILYGNILEE